MDGPRRGEEVAHLLGLSREVRVGEAHRQEQSPGQRGVLGEFWDCSVCGTAGCREAPHGAPLPSCHVTTWAQSCFCYFPKQGICSSGSAHGFTLHFPGSQPDHDLTLCCWGSWGPFLPGCHLLPHEVLALLGQTPPAGPPRQGRSAPAMHLS